MVVLWECKSRGPETHRDYVPRSVSVKLETSEIGSGPPAGQVIGQNEAERSHSRDFSSVCPRQSSEARKMSQSQIQRCRPIGCLIPLFGSSGGHQDSNDYFTPSAVPRLRPIVVIGAKKGILVPGLGIGGCLTARVTRRRTVERSIANQMVLVVHLSLSLEDLTVQVFWKMTRKICRGGWTAVVVKNRLPVSKVKWPVQAM